jgi:16S rRNA (uracil1498-N3)-methyltransferase
MQLFYVPEITGNSIILNEHESKHAIKVMRLKRKDLIQLTDGKGGLYTAEIIEANPGSCRLEIIESQQHFGRRRYHTHIAIAPTKNNERLEWFIEKATEIGVDEISFIFCDKSERKTVKMERMEKILISAMKQSIKAYLPRLNKTLPLAEFLANKEADQKFIAHCHNDHLPHLKNEVKKEKSVIVLIGPEGDFSSNEIEQAKKFHFNEISLGDARLRTETAGIVACHIINLFND